MFNFTNYRSPFLPKQTEKFMFCLLIISLNKYRIWIEFKTPPDFKNDIYDTS